MRCALILVAALIACMPPPPPPCPRGDIVEPGICIRGHRLDELGPFVTATAERMGGTYDGLDVQFERSHEDIPFECVAGIFYDDTMSIVTLPQTLAHELGHVDVFVDGKQVDTPPGMSIEQASRFQHSPAAGWTLDVQQRVADTKKAVPPPWLGEVCKHRNAE